MSTYSMDAVKTYIKKGKDAVLNTPEIERKVKDATSNDKWGPTGTQMLEISRASYSYECFPIIMGVIWKRINDPGKYWRHVYKSLLLIDYLVRNGSEQVIRDCRHHTMEIKTLVEFQYIEDEKDVGLSVRERAKQVIELLHDDKRIKEERQKAKSNQNKYVGIGNDSRDMGYGGGGGGYGGYDSHGRGGYDSDYGGGRDSYGSSNRDSYGGSSRDSPYGGGGNNRDSYGGSSRDSPYGGSGNRDSPYGGGNSSRDSPYGGGSNSRDSPYGGSSNRDSPYGGGGRDDYGDYNSSNDDYGNGNNTTSSGGGKSKGFDFDDQPTQVRSRPRAPSGGNLQVGNNNRSNDSQLIDFSDPSPQPPKNMTFDPLDGMRGGQQGQQNQYGGQQVQQNQYGGQQIQQGQMGQFHGGQQIQQNQFHGGQQGFDAFGSGPMGNQQKDPFSKDEFGDFNSSNNLAGNMSEFNPFDQPSGDFQNGQSQHGGNVKQLDNSDPWAKKDLFDLSNLGKQNQPNPSTTGSQGSKTRSVPARNVNGPITSAGSTLGGGGMNPNMNYNNNQMNRNMQGGGMMQGGGYSNMTGSLPSGGMQGGNMMMGGSGMMGGGGMNPNMNYNNNQMNNNMNYNNNQMNPMNRNMQGGGMMMMGGGGYRS